MEIEKEKKREDDRGFAKGEILLERLNGQLWLKVWGIQKRLECLRKRLLIEKE